MLQRHHLVESVVGDLINAVVLQIQPLDVQQICEQRLFKLFQKVVFEIKNLEMEEKMSFEFTCIGNEWQ